MSKLMDIKESFESKIFMLHPIVVHDISEQFNPHTPTRRNWWTHCVTMLVYPHNGLYKLSELSAFAKNIASRTALFTQTEFTVVDDIATFAELSRDEPIGKYVQADPAYLQIDDPDIELPDEFIDGVRYVAPGKAPTDPTLWRRIIVRIYPDKAYAQSALRGVGVKTTTRVRSKANAFIRPARS